MIITNQHNLPEPVFKALTHSDYSRGSSNRSVTQLIDSPRVRILKKEHDDEIFEDASDMLWSVLGTSVHHMFEQHEPDGHIVEERLYAEVENWVISGAIDVQRAESDGSVTVLDYKCTSVWSVIYGKKEWHNQLNFYAWLVDQSKDIEVNNLQIVAVLRDWQRSKANFEESYPKAPLVIVDIPLWSQQVRDKYVRDRVKLHQDAEFERLTGGELPLCSDAERWKKDSSFAVMAKGQKRAKRVFADHQSAEDYIAQQSATNLNVEERVGKYTRCEDNWCRVAQFCDQHGGNENGN